MSASTPAASQPDRPDTVAALAGVPPGSASVPALRLVGLVKTFDRKVAVDQLSLDIPVSSFYGIVGPNGAGKTTSLSMATGLLRPDAGQVLVHGVDVWAEPRRAKALLGVLPDGLRTFDRLNGLELVTYSGLLRGLERDVVVPRATELVKVLGLWDAGTTLVADYSAGMRKKIHLACIYAAAIGTLLSSTFILAANSWMQNPVGTRFNAELGRAEIAGLDGFIEIMTNPLLRSTVPHIIFASYMVAGGLIAGISAWHLARANGGAEVPEADVKAYRWATKFGAWVLIAGSALTFLTGDAQAKDITKLQPSKIAAAEGAFEDTGDFSLLTIPNADQTGTIIDIKVPGVLSFIAGVPQIKGIDTIREQYSDHGYSKQDGSQTGIQTEYAPHLAEKYAGINPIPDVNATYWSFRFMMIFGGAGMLIGLLLLWVTRKGRSPKPSKLWTTLMAAMPLLPLFGISFGWIFTEMGRQPWLVAGVMPTEAGISPTASAGDVLFSLIVYTLLYGLLAVIEVGLFLHYTAKGLPEVTEPTVSEDPDAPMSFAY